MDNTNLKSIRKTTFVPVIVPVIIFKSLFSKVKIHESKNKDGKPCVDPGCNWWVYYYYRSPYDNKMHKFIEKRGINRISSVTERRKAANQLKRALTRLLQDGFNPFDKKKKTSLEITIEKIKVLDALDEALKRKKREWGEKTQSTNVSLFNVFRSWVIDNNLHDKYITEINKRHIAVFLNSLNVGNISRNNYRRVISTLFKYLVTTDVIPYNFVGDIPKLKEKPTKNKRFTATQIGSIKEYLLKNDPYLHKYLQFITYAFLRPIEVNRITCNDIDLTNNIIFIRTKTDNRATVRIINKLKPIIETLELDKYQDHDVVFTNKKIPYKWETIKEKSKYDWFSRRFLKMKKQLNLSNEYGMYSFRHSFAYDLFKKYLADGLTDLEAKHKLMTITRHRSLSGLSNYLRDIGAFVPNDYSDDYTIDF